MNLFSAGHLINEEGKKLSRPLSAGLALFPPALYEKVLRGVSNNILKNAKGTRTKSNVQCPMSKVKNTYLTLDIGL